MKNTTRKILSLAPHIGILFFLVPAFANAAVPNTVRGLVGLLCVAFGWLFYILIVFAIITIVLAGFNYATAGDDPEKVKKATKMILYCAIAIAVALLAKGIPAIVGNFIGSTQNLIAC